MPSGNWTGHLTGMESYICLKMVLYWGNIIKAGQFQNDLCQHKEPGNMVGSYIKLRCDNVILTGYLINQKKPRTYPASFLRQSR